MCLIYHRIIGILLLSSVAISGSCFSTQVVNYRLPSTTIDQYENYTIELLRLALESTRPSHGDYRLQPLPDGVNRLRAKKAIASNEYPNLIIEDSYDGSENEDVTYIEFPVDLGILSYRVCFVSERATKAVAMARSVDELKQYRILQGINWTDTKVLNVNEFKTIEVSAYKSSFRMVASNRADLFCLGASQIMNEYFNNHSGLQLTINESFYLHYQLPRFFFLSSSNKSLKKRIEQGLLIAYQNQTLQALWEKNFLASLIFVNLNTRKGFELKNPYNDELNTSYEKFILPLAEISVLIDKHKTAHPH